MVHLRKFWLQKIDKGLSKNRLVWLCGARGVGKTTICRSIDSSEYFDCSLSSTRNTLSPDSLTSISNSGTQRIVFDDIHRLVDPVSFISQTLEQSPNLQLLVTAPCSYGHCEKFPERLSQPPLTMNITPLTLPDMIDFNSKDMESRFLRGGLPEFFETTDLAETTYESWLDDFCAKDVQEIYRLGKRQSFLSFAQLLCEQSGEMFSAKQYADKCDSSRMTAASYLEILEKTFFAHVIRPFTTRKSSEIVSAPKVYCFDTGLVCNAKGWHELRRGDYDVMWKHFVLNEMKAHLQGLQISYWQDKRNHEIDFVLARRLTAPTAIECVWQAENYNPSDLMSFRKQYPAGDNFVVAGDVKTGYSVDYKGVKVKYVALESIRTGSE